MGNHSQPSRAQEHIVNQTNYLGKAAQHVFQQLNHFPTSSHGLFVGWREIVERLACRDGSSQHRPPWTTLTTTNDGDIMERLACRDGSTKHRPPWTTLTTNNDGERCGSTS